MHTDRTYRLVHIGAGGITGYYAPAARLETTSHRDIAEFLAALEDGGFAIDVRGAVDRDIRLAFRSPYVDPFLPQGKIANEHGLDRDLLSEVARGFWGPAVTPMLDTGDGYPFTGFDTVSLDVYVDFWRRGGARIGRRDGDVFRWEDEASDTTAPTPEGRRPN